MAQEPILDLPHIKSIDEEIEELVTLIRNAQEQLTEVEAEIRPTVDAARERLKMLLEYRGKNWSDDEGYARLVADGTRITYDAEALDALVIENPDKYGWLKEYRQEVPVRGGIRVK